MIFGEKPNFIRYTYVYRHASIINLLSIQLIRRGNKVGTSRLSSWGIRFHNVAVVTGQQYHIGEKPAVMVD